MSPDWPELINALASAQRSLASEITCGVTYREQRGLNISENAVVRSLSSY